MIEETQMRELVALAVAVTLRCDGCITVHTEAAIKQGSSNPASLATSVTWSGISSVFEWTH